MTLPKELTTVTTVSKSLAIVLFVSLPVVGFLLGMRHEQIISSPSIITNYPSPAATQSASTANWKTYSNDALKIQFRYPNSWEVIPYTSDVGAMKKGIVIRPVENSGPIRIVGYSFTGDAEAYIKENYYPTSQDIENLTKKALNYTLKTTEYKIKWKDDIQKYGAGTTTSLTIVENSSQKFIFENYTSQENPLDQILSTFKFTQ